MKKPKLDVMDVENPVWTKEDFARAKPANEVLPPELLAVLPKRAPGQRGPGKRPAKEAINIRLSPDVLDSFRATGDGWQGRVDAALRDWLKLHRLG